MKNKALRPEIFIHPALKNEIAYELRCTAQTVMMAIKYVNNSNLGKSIRKKAKQKLIEEANQVSI